jgi:hypothetical protein
MRWGGSEYMEHIKPLRLFDLSQAESRKSNFRLEDWEKEHLRECDECQHIVEVFARQFTSERPPHDEKKAS